MIDAQVNRFISLARNADGDISISISGDSPAAVRAMDALDSQIPIAALHVYGAHILVDISRFQRIEELHLHVNEVELDRIACACQTLTIRCVGFVFGVGTLFQAPAIISIDVMGELDALTIPAIAEGLRANQVIQDFTLTLNNPADVSEITAVLATKQTMRWLVLYGFIMFPTLLPGVKELIVQVYVQDIYLSAAWGDGEAFTRNIGFAGQRVLPNLRIFLQANMPSEKLTLKGAKLTVEQILELRGLPPNLSIDSISTPAVPAMGRLGTDRLALDFIRAEDGASLGPFLMRSRESRISFETNAELGFDTGFPNLITGLVRQEGNRLQFLRLSGPNAFNMTQFMALVSVIVQCRTLRGFKIRVPPGRNEALMIRMLTRAILVDPRHLLLEQCTILSSLGNYELGHHRADVANLVLAHLRESVFNVMYAAFPRARPSALSRFLARTGDNALFVRVLLFLLDGDARGFTMHEMGI